MPKSAQTLTAWLFVSGSLIALLSARPCAAQIDLNRYAPAVTTRDGFAVARPLQPGHLNVGALLQLDYAKDPLIWRRNADDEARRHIVSDQLAMHDRATSVRNVLIDAGVAPERLTA